MLDKNNDPVRLYLREMGTVPLLKRADQVAIAKRRRGHLMVPRAIRVLYRSEGIDFRWQGPSPGSLSIKKIVPVRSEELTKRN